MLTQLSNQLGYYYNQAKTNQKTKQEVLTILNRKKSNLSLNDRKLTPEQLAVVTEKFDHMITLVNRLPD